ncbi:hypothetical protein [Prosthecobacter debontii]|uniref:hypothetical protein n=1 Tax=Prosthecobacter debontii TaxID=48467 RepID=UPI00099AD303|nr:hypothetical protein [Prosthecobacter debontii]
MKLLAPLLGALLGAIVTQLLVDLFGIRVDAILDHNVEVIAGDRYYLFSLGMLAGAILASCWWRARHKKAEAKLPWNQKRQGGPILPGASPEFLKRHGGA